MKLSSIVVISIVLVVVAVLSGCAKKEPQSKSVRQIVSKYENGAPKEIVYYSDGTQTGKETLDQSGNVVASSGNVPTQIDECCDNKGAVRWSGALKDKKREGVCKHYTPEGGVEFEGSYKDDKLHGQSKYYDKKGEQKYECTYLNGKRDGVSKYYEKGKLKIAETYKNNKRHGVCAYYDEKGETSQVDTYDNDKLIKRKKNK